MIFQLTKMFFTTICSIERNNNKVPKTDFFMSYNIFLLKATFHLNFL